MLAARTAVFLATLVFFNLLTLTRAFSWFDKGHRIVGLIAQAELTTEARKEIAKILFGGFTLGGCLRLAGSRGAKPTRVRSASLRYDSRERHCI